ncbi:MAG: PLP-dependent aminotransferase family protein [Lachnospiraceae bacterium]|nr:PLP-dependent aminotransferase family protein [Lachnospiraceae bacterium]
MKELLIVLNSHDKMPLYEQIYAYIRQEIREKKIDAGEGLPSSRALSKQLLVSRSTVDLAYEQLVSEGYIESIPCKGYYVCEMEELYQLKLDKQEQPVKDQRTEQRFRFDFAVNGIDPDGFPQNAWRKISKQVLQEGKKELFQLGDSRGEEGLRRGIADYLHYARGMHTTAEQIIVGAGNDYLLMLLSVILGKNTRIAMENPTYRSAWQCFVNLGHECLAVPMDESGMCPMQLESSGADVAYVMPAHQFPMGMVMPMKRRLQLLAWAKAGEGRYIIEDDYDSEFRYKGKPIPALQGYDQQDSVIYLGTFSKAIAPAIRISYMVLPKSLLAAYDRYAHNFSATVSRMDQRIIEIFLRDGYFERHLNKMRALYKSKHDKMLRYLRQMSELCEVSGEHAGVHMLVWLKKGMTEERAVMLAQEAGIRVYPLHAYTEAVSAIQGQAVLLGYATIPEDSIQAAVTSLADAWRT